jgi:GC-rich sequence DNA-binding factor
MIQAYSEEEDEETMEWEQEQLRRGGNIAAADVDKASVKQIYKAASSMFHPFYI